MQTMSTSVLTLLLVVSSFWLTSCECGSEPAESGATGRTRTSLLLNWFPEAEHGGFYAADVLGLYEGSGLDVTIHAGRPDEPVIAQVGTGRMDFGVVNAAEVLTGRSQGVPVVAVMAPLQTNPRCILVEEEDGIESESDEGCASDELE